MRGVAVKVQSCARNPLHPLWVRIGIDCAVVACAGKIVQIDSDALIEVVVEHQATARVHGVVLGQPEDLPVAEVHISDVRTREPFRHHSYVADVAVIHVIGEGVDGYATAVRRLIAVIAGQADG